MKTFVSFSDGHFTQNLSVASFTQHSMCFRNSFTQFDTKFHSRSFLHYERHIKIRQNQNETITQTAVTLPNITQAVWNKLLCAGYCHNYQRFHVNPHMHDWGRSTWSFMEILGTPYICIYFIHIQSFQPCNISITKQFEKSLKITLPQKWL
jgi:hypothetical protein